MEACCSNIVHVHAMNRLAQEVWGLGTVQASQNLRAVLWLNIKDICGFKNHIKYKMASKEQHCATLPLFISTDFPGDRVNVEKK